MSFEAAGGKPAIPHPLRGFVEDVVRSFVLKPLVIRESKGSLDAHHLVGSGRLVLPLGPPGQLRTYTVLQGSVRVHREGVEWPRASIFLYPADAPVPEVSRASGNPVLLVTTHPTNVSTQLIPFAQLTYIRTDTPGAPSAEALAQVVVTTLHDPPRVRLSSSSGRPWDLNPRLLHTIRHGGALRVHAKLRRGVKASLHGED